MRLFERFLAAEDEFFGYFSYYPDRCRYPERFPILDFRSHHWLLIGAEKPLGIFHSVQPLSGLRLEIGRGIFADVILDCSGSNSNSDAKGSIWRGAEFTLIATGLPADDSRRFRLFSNVNECRNPFLAKQALAQISGCVHNF
jgi:hypothetical protein